MTDPSRTLDPVALVAHLPPGAAVIYRTFGAPDAEQVAAALRRATRVRKVLLLIGADEQLAAQVGADGLHLPERRLSELTGIRARRRRWIITAAAHSARALLRADRVGADAILLSAIFDSRSPSADPALGPIRLALLTDQVKTPVLALGGVNGNTAMRLLGTRCAGLAAIDGWAA